MSTGVLTGDLSIEAMWAGGWLTVRKHRPSTAKAE